MPLDVKLRGGAFKRVLPCRMPLVLGHDLAGTVVAVGPETRRFDLGDEVFGCAGTNWIGSFAERITVAETDWHPSLPASAWLPDCSSTTLVAVRMSIGAGHAAPRPVRGLGAAKSRLRAT